MKSARNRPLPSKSKQKQVNELLVENNKSVVEVLHMMLDLKRMIERKISEELKNDLHP